MRPTVLLVEDEELNSLFIREVLDDAGCDLIVHRDPMLTIRAVEASEIAAASVNIGSLQREAEQLLHDIRALRPIMPVLLTTARDSRCYEHDFSKDPCLIVLPKPYDELQFMLALRMLIGEPWAGQQQARIDMLSQEPEPVL